MKKATLARYPRAIRKILEDLRSEVSFARPKFYKYNLTRLLDELAATPDPDRPDRKCIYCGCDDSHACKGGCSWAAKFPHGNVGICSQCVAVPQVPARFIQRMHLELRANQHKGDWAKWKPSRDEAFSELAHHLTKLKFELRNEKSTAKKRKIISELTADIANISSKIYELFGELYV